MMANVFFTTQPMLHYPVQFVQNGFYGTFTLAEDQTHTFKLDILKFLHNFHVLLKHKEDFNRQKVRLVTATRHDT